MPLVVHYPGVVRAGAVCRRPTCNMDFYPILLLFSKEDCTPGIFLALVKEDSSNVLLEKEPKRGCRHQP